MIGTIPVPCTRWLPLATAPIFPWNSENNVTFAVVRGFHHRTRGSLAHLVAAI